MLQTFSPPVPEQAPTVPGSETKFRTSSENRQNREAEHQPNPLRYFNAAVTAAL
jgi:hypothetical protein